MKEIKKGTTYNYMIYDFRQGKIIEIVKKFEVAMSSSFSREQ